MQASRISSCALKAVAAGSKQTRGLHMTGPATFSSLLTSERPAMNLPQSEAGLRYECQRLRLPTTGSKEELHSRLSAYELTTSRPISTAAIPEAKRPLVGASVSGRSFRHFNTSRELKKPNDSSTIDFAFIPDFDPDLNSSPIGIRVPILHTTAAPHPEYAYLAAETEEEVMPQMIHTVSSHVYAPAAAVDFQGLAFSMASKIARPVEETASMARTIWSGLVEDVLGPGQQKGRPA